MAIYRFRVRFEDYDDVVRDIEIKAGQTFQQLHDCINQAIGFDGKLPSSFFLSDENWKKGKEFSNKVDHNSNGKVLSLKESKLTAFINDPHQKIYFVMEADPDWEFQIEMIKITNEEAKTVYPRCIKSVGEAPKQYGVTKLGKEKKEFDFLGEAKYEEAGEGFEPDAGEEEIALAEGAEPNDTELAGGEDNLNLGEDFSAAEPGVEE